jgi:hypothetical protein
VLLGAAAGAIVFCVWPGEGSMSICWVVVMMMLQGKNGQVGCVPVRLYVRQHPPGGSGGAAGHHSGHCSRQSGMTGLSVKSGCRPLQAHPVPPAARLGYNMT